MMNVIISNPCTWEGMILYTYNVILSIKALNTMAKLEIEKHFGQEACQCTCSFSFSSRIF